MRVMVLVKANENSEAGEMPRPELMAAMMAYNERLAQAGILVTGDGLKPSSQGVRVHVDGDSRTVSRGPFAAPRELVAGFWIWQVGSMDEALEWALQCPNPHNGPSDIEIRPLFEAEDFAELLTPEIQAQWQRIEAMEKARQAG